MPRRALKDISSFDRSPDRSRLICKSGKNRAGVRAAVEIALRRMLSKEGARSEIGTVECLKLEGPTEKHRSSKLAGRSMFTARLGGDSVSIAIPVEVEWSVDREGMVHLESVAPDGSAYGLRLEARR